jgi:hypothetical protein
LPSADERKSFFQDFYESGGTYIGIGGNKHAYNSHCAEHDHLTEETTAEETTIMTESETEFFMEFPTEDVNEITETTVPARLIPWHFGD